TTNAARLFPFAALKLLQLGLELLDAGLEAPHLPLEELHARDGGAQDGSEAIVGEALELVDGALRRGEERVERAATGRFGLARRGDDRLERTATRRLGAFGGRGEGLERLEPLLIGALDEAPHGRLSDGG